MSPRGTQSDSKARCRSTILATYGSGKDRGAVVYQIQHRAGIDAVDAIRLAIRHHVRTRAGRATARSNGGDYNWGDAALELPPKLLARHAIHSFEALQVDAWVNHDENFYDPLDDPEPQA